MNKSLLGASLAAGIALAGCGESGPKVNFEETSKKCESILFGLGNECKITGVVRNVDLDGRTYYSIAGVAGKEKDTGKVSMTNVPENIKSTVDDINSQVKEKFESSWFSTNVVTGIKSITFNGSAVGNSSNIWNVENGRYKAGYGVVDTNNSRKALEANVINAKGRCNSTISDIGNSIAPRVVNNVECKGNVFNFSDKEISALNNLGGWVKELLPNWRINFSSSITAFSFIKYLESGKEVPKEFMTSNEAMEALRIAEEIVKEKHFVDIDNVYADVEIAGKRNELSVLSSLFGAGLIGYGLALLLARRFK